MPKNVEGDIYIGGVGIADGYQNDQKQTDAAFIQHKTLGRIYRTGDRDISPKRAVWNLRQTGYAGKDKRIENRTGRS